MHQESNQQTEQNVPSLGQDNNPLSSKPDNVLNEPEAVYQPDKRVRWFTSFEEAEEANAKEMAAISPEAHLQNATNLIKRIYADELKQPMDKTIKFKE